MRLVRKLIDSTFKINNKLIIVVLKEREDNDEHNKIMYGMKLNRDASVISYCSSDGVLSELEFRN